MYNDDDNNNHDDNNKQPNGFTVVFKLILIIIFFDILINATLKQPDASVQKNTSSKETKAVEYKYLGIMLNENKEVIHYWYSKNIFKNDGNTYRIEDSNGQFIYVTSPYFINIPVKNDKDLTKIKTEYNIK